jgi:hypothetical protein
MLNKNVIKLSAVSIAVTGRAYSAEGGTSVLSLMGAEYMSVTATSVGTTAWSSGVLTLKVSNSKEGPFMALPSSITLTNAAPVTTVVDVRGYAYAVLDVTTAQSSVVLDLSACLYAAA